MWQTTDKNVFLKSGYTKYKKMYLTIFVLGCAKIKNKINLNTYFISFQVEIQSWKKTQRYN
jgi:hypothetical protein